MSMTSGEMTPADIFAVTCGGRNGRNDGLFGGDGIVGLIALIIISGMFGFGGFGFGGGGMGGIFPWLLMSGGFNGFGGYGGNAAMQGALTRGDLCMDMNFNDVQNGVRNVNDAVNTGFANLNSTICHQQYDTAQLVNGINNNLSNGFHGVDNSICTLGYQNAQLINGVQRQISDCCCENRTGQLQLGNAMERGFCDVNYTAATNANAIIQNSHNDTDRVLAKLDAMEMARKDETIADLRSKLAACGDQTTAQYIINQLTGVISPRAVPAYPASAPCGLGNWSAQVLANNQWNNNGCNNGCCGCNG